MYVCGCVWVCGCVCVCEREREIDAFQHVFGFQKFLSDTDAIINVWVCEIMAMTSSCSITFLLHILFILRSSFIFKCACLFTLFCLSFSTYIILWISFNLCLFVLYYNLVFFSLSSHVDRFSIFLFHSFTHSTGTEFTTHISIAINRSEFSSRNVEKNFDAEISMLVLFCHSK